MKKLILICSFFTFTALNAQEFEWVKTNSGPLNESVSAITTDAAGNTYTCGTFAGTVDFDPSDVATMNITAESGEFDAFIQKLNSDGELIWVKSFGGVSGTNPTGIAVDNDGNCYTTGRFVGTVDFDPSGGTLNLTSNASFDPFIQKLNSDGDLIWARAFGGTLFDEGTAITTDDSGNCYTVGRYSGTSDLDPSAAVASYADAADQSVFIQKLDSDGLFVWGRQLETTATSRATPEDISLDASNNVIICGYFDETVDFDPSLGTDYDVTALADGNGFILKLDEAGLFQWMTPYLTTSGAYPISIQTDEDDNIFAIGIFMETFDFDPSAGLNELTSAGSWDIFIQKLEANANHVWTNAYGGVGFDYANDHVLDNDGYIYTTGSYTGTVDFDPSGDVFELTSSQSFLHKSNSDGDFIWATDASSGHVAAGIENDVYISGGFTGSFDFDPGAGDASLTVAGATDAFIVKFVSTCSIDITVTQTGATFMANQVGAVYQWVDCNDGNAAIVGETNQSFTPTINGNYAVEVTFDGCTETSGCTAIGDVGINENKITTNIYPNPTSGILNITANTSIQSVGLFSLSGQQLALFTTSQIDISDFPSGIYLLQINGENGTAYQKISKF